MITALILAVPYLTGKAAWVAGSVAVAGAVAGGAWVIKFIIDAKNGKAL